MSTKVTTLKPVDGIVRIGAKTYERVQSIAITVDTTPLPPPPFVIPLGSSASDAIPEIRLVRHPYTQYAAEYKSQREQEVIEAQRLAEFLYTQASGHFMDEFQKAYRKLVNS